MLEDYRWFKKYLKALEYKKEHGNCNVRIDYVTKDGFKLGSWLKSQRVAYRNNMLSDEKISFLKGLDLDFSTQKTKWDKMYSILEEYYSKNNNPNISTHYETDKMGNWINIQRQKYKKDKLSNEHIKMLNMLEFEWSKCDTLLLNQDINQDNSDNYKAVMLERMKHILKDLDYEVDGSITNLDNQKQLEKEIIKRMWR